MFEYILFLNFMSNLLTLLVGVGLLWYIRRRTTQHASEHRPAGFWVRAICLGTDLAIIEIIALFLAYHGSLVMSGYITFIITLSYFFFFWLFFSATPAGMIARLRIAKDDGSNITPGQMFVRLGLCLFLFFGWVTMLFDVKKRTLHDIAARTKVVYAAEAHKPKAASRWDYVLLGIAAVLLVSLIAAGKIIL